MTGGATVGATSGTPGDAEIGDGDELGAIDGVGGGSVDGSGSTEALDVGEGETCALAVTGNAQVAAATDRGTAVANQSSDRPRI